MRIGLALFLLGFLSVGGIYYIKIDNERWNKQFQANARLASYEAETRRVQAEADKLKARVEELRLVADKGMVIR